MTDLHRVFWVLPGESLHVNALEQTVVARLYLVNLTGVSRVLLWTESEQGSCFLMASGPDYLQPEIVSYIPVEVAPHEEGWVFEELVYSPAHGGHSTWLNETQEKAVEIYKCFADTGADILIVELPDGVRAFAHRSRYHWQNVQ